MKFFVSCVTNEPKLRRELLQLGSTQGEGGSEAAQRERGTGSAEEGTHFFPTTQCQVVPYNLSNSCLICIAISFSMLYRSMASEDVSTARVCISSDTTVSD